MDPDWLVPATLFASTIIAFLFTSIAVWHMRKEQQGR
jgi:hypothetical protein